MRNWTFIDEDNYDFDEDSIEHKVKQQMLDKLCSEWNEVNTRIERSSWQCEDELSERHEYMDEQCSEFAEQAKENSEKEGLSPDECKAAYEAAYNLKAKEFSNKDQEDIVKRAAIEGLLSSLGARMMRPYEHHNEEEAYFEYMENRYDYDERY